MYRLKFRKYSWLILTFIIVGSLLAVAGSVYTFDPDTDLSNADASFWGEDVDDWSGYSVAGAGDVNGDGLDDILIGAYRDDDGGGGAGQTYLILGRGAADWGMDYDLSNADASFLGEDWGDFSGKSVAGAGDVNGDGLDDILIGAFYDDDGGDYAGQTYLILGRGAADWGMDYDLSNADASFWGEDADDYSGQSVAGAGDVNGDGRDDILIGAPRDEDGGGDWAGQTYLILGRGAADWGMDYDLSNADASFWGEDADDYSGTSVAGAGDVNGDGRDDILIGADGDDDGGNVAGQTYLILGRGAADWGMDYDLSIADASFWGEDGSDRSGISVAGAGDVNGDGRDDILIGAYYDDDGGNNAGQTYLILGNAGAPWGMDYDLSNADASFWGEDAEDWSGYSIAGAGDVNGDGLDDILIGVYGDDDGGDRAGQTYLILGRGAADWGMDYDLSDADASFWGEDADDESGWSVAGAGDVNGDGRDDILIGAYGDDDGGDYAGQTYLLLGSLGVPPPIVPAFEGDPTVCDAPPCCVTFTNLTTGGALPYQDAIWGFGDGTLPVQGQAIHNGQTYTHCYAQPGVYDVDLTMWDGDGTEADEVKPDYITVGWGGPTHTWTFYAAGFFPKHLPDSYNGEVVLANLELANIPPEVQGVWWYDGAALDYKFWVPGVGGDLTTLTGRFYNYLVLVTGACDWEIPLP